MLFVCRPLAHNQGTTSKVGMHPPSLNYVI